MKLELLTKALKHYVLSADCKESDREDVFDAIIECSAVAERFDGRDIWKDTAYIVAAGSMDMLLNMATYDIYGQLAKPRNGNVSFSLYEDTVRSYGLKDMSTSALMLGYDVLSDLWRSNEESGDHNPDGTFNKDGTLPGGSLKQYMYDLRDCLSDARRVVEAYYATNKDFLEDEDANNVQELIATIIKLTR